MSGERFTVPREAQQRQLLVAAVAAGLSAAGPGKPRGKSSRHRRYEALHGARVRQELKCARPASRALHEVRRRHHVMMI
jgi:hypothetical protein